MGSVTPWGFPLNASFPYLAWKIRQNAPILRQGTLLVPPPKYLQPGLVIDAIINFAMSRNKSYYIIGKTYVKCKCLVFISICLYTDLDYKVVIYKN